LLYIVTIVIYEYNKSFIFADICKNIFEIHKKIIIFLIYCNDVIVLSIFSYVNNSYYTYICIYTHTHSICIFFLFVIKSNKYLIMFFYICSDSEPNEDNEDGVDGNEDGKCYNIIHRTP